MKDLLTGKVAIVNGGTTGMGSATAVLFAQEGANVVIAGRSEANGKKTAREASAKVLKASSCLVILPT